MVVPRDSGLNFIIRGINNEQLDICMARTRDQGFVALKVIGSIAYKQQHMCIVLLETKRSEYILKSQML